MYVYTYIYIYIYVNIYDIHNPKICANSTGGYHLRKIGI